MDVHLFTGFPGFLGSALLPRVLARSPESKAVCVVQGRYSALARRRIGELSRDDPSLEDRVVLADGDITRPDLGLDQTEELVGYVTEIWHLAAAYDLAVTRALALAVNVDGTRRVLDMAARCPSLRRFHHLSTCYVSGRHPGMFTENDLALGQSFNNAYEETKHLAEREVRDRMEGGLPATIYRPTIIVGDSRTGATQKYDGPYPFIRLILRQPGVAVLPMVGDPDTTPVNVVPRDTVVDAVTYLSGLDRSAGRTYHLADPDPVTVSEMVELVSRAAHRRVVRPRLPEQLVKGTLERVPSVSRLMGVSIASLAYLSQPTRYGTEQSRAELAAGGIVVPPFASYVGPLVEFVRRHPDIDSSAMV